MRRPDRAPTSLVRRFVTPERVDLRIELGSATARAIAFLLDWFAIVAILGSITTAFVSLGPESMRDEMLGILWLIGLFVLRNGWFVLFEMGRRGATPGKRLLGLRVIARDGGRLTPAAVVARNALREIEIFLPLSFLGIYAAGEDGAVSGWLLLFALLWTGIFFLFPLFNRDRLRVGDLVAGTWVVTDTRGAPAADVVARAAAAPRRTFTDAALDLYGIYELQMLEDVLRQRREAALVTVAATIRRKAGLADDGDDIGFLTDYYEALCARLERGMMVGRRREDKY